jgi:DNA mismatch endonuclease (patch repair protein)
MQAVPSIDTTVEVALRSRLHQDGLRFRKGTRPEASIRCKADIVFRRARVCIFVDGCFWHGCPRHFHCPKSNAAWWREKIDDNIARDERQTRCLTQCGWTVIRLWEHEVADHLDECVHRIEGAVS